MKRPLLSKDLIKEGEFLVEYKKGESAQKKSLPFTINPDSITNVNSVCGGLIINRIGAVSDNVWLILHSIHLSLVKLFSSVLMRLFEANKN